MRHRSGTADGRGRSRRRLLSWIALGLAGTLLLLGGGAYAAYLHYDGLITRIAIPSLGRSSPSAQSAGPATVQTGEYFLIAGSDTRAFAGGSAFQASAGSADYVSGQRSDTVILIHIPAGTAKATILSFPRDSYVEIPTYTSSTEVVTPAHMAKLNEAFALGGPALLVQLIRNLTGLPVDHYLQVDFAGFRNIVDAVGGVSLCVGTTRSDADSGDYLTAGTHGHVTGDQALAFVRDRKGLAAGDIARIKDQQYFLSQVMKKVLSAGTLSNPLTLHALLSAVTKDLTVDSGFGLTQISTLAGRLRSLDPAHVTFLTLPITNDNGSRVIHGLTQSVVLLDSTKTPDTFRALAGQGARSAAPSPSASGAATPSPTATAGTVTSESAAASTCAP
jgi:LCP family protein required for cell wall assembly